jgi:hypothetical protein
MDLPTVTALLWLLFVSWLAYCSRLEYLRRRKGA